MIYKNQTQQQADAISGPKFLWYDGKRGITVFTESDIPYEQTAEGVAAQAAEVTERTGAMFILGNLKAGTATLAQMQKALAWIIKKIQNQ